MRDVKLDSILYKKALEGQNLFIICSEWGLNSFFGNINKEEKIVWFQNYPLQLINLNNYPILMLHLKNGSNLRIGFSIKEKLFFAELFHEVYKDRKKETIYRKVDDEATGYNIEEVLQIINENLITKSEINKNKR